MMPGWKMGRCSALLLFCALFTGCQALKAPINDESNGAIYRPPTPVTINQNTNQSIPELASPQAGDIGNADLSQQPTCTNNLVYIADQTIPDGTQVSPGAVLDKQWEVENQGTCNWDDYYHLKLIAGPQLSAPLEQALYPARSGAQAVIRILFTAPQELGNYRSAWQAYSPSDEPFGDPIFIEIVVAEGTASP